MGITNCIAGLCYDYDSSAESNRRRAKIFDPKPDAALQTQPYRADHIRRVASGGLS